MARQTSFGEALAHARERKGLDLSTAARKLRIRPDILRAIEEGDFARMPPRGYTSNMVGAYARLVGLNPTEVTRAYREEVYQFETGRRPASNRRERPRDAGRTVALPSSRDRGSSRGSYRDDYAGSPRSGRSGLGGSSARTGRAAPQPQYTNLVQGRQAPGIAANIGSYLPLIIVGRSFGQERANTTTVTRAGAARQVLSASELLEEMRRLQAHPEELQSMIEGGKNLRKPDSARSVALATLDKIGKVKRLHNIFVFFYWGGKPLRIR